MSQSDRLLIAQLDVSIRSLERSMRKAGIVTDQMTDKMEKRWERMNRRVSKRSEQMARDVRRAIAGVAIGLAGREVTQYADAWVDLNNKLAAASQISGTQTRSLMELQAAAADSRAEIEGYTDLYARLIRMSGKLQASEADVARATQIVSRAFAAGGAAASEQAAGIMQLGQGLNGVLQGDELRSVRENAPVLFEAIAKGLGVASEELKEMGAQGKLTGKVVFDAIMKSGDAIDEAFGATNARKTEAARQSFERLGLAIGEYADRTGVVESASEDLAKAIDFVADNVDAFADAIVIAGTALAGYMGASAVAVVVKGLSDTAKGATVAARAFVMLSAATNFLGGPWVLGITAAAAALAYLALKGNGAQKALEDLEGAIDDAEKALRDTAKYADLSEIGDSASMSIPYVDGLATSINKVVSALQDATVAQFLRDMGQLQTSIIEVESAIAAAERKKGGLVNQARLQAGARSSRTGQLGTPSINEDDVAGVKEINRELGEARAALAGLRSRQENIFGNVFEDGVKEQISNALKSGDVKAAAEALKGQLVSITGETGGSRTTAVPADDNKDALKLIKEVEDAYRAAFETEIEQINRIEKERLASIERQLAAGELKPAKAQELSDKVIAIAQNERDELEKANEARLQSDLDATDAILKKHQDAADEKKRQEDDLLAYVLASRDYALNRTAALLEREYSARRTHIENTIRDEEKKTAALIALGEEEASAKEDLRKRLYGEGEYSDNPVERMMAQQEAELEALNEFHETYLTSLEDFEARKAEIQLKYAEMYASATEQGLSAATSNMKKAFGEQSGIYKAFFALQQAAAIAAAGIALYQNMAEASKVGFPQNIPLIAGALAQGTAIIAGVKSVQATFGGGRERGGPVTSDKFYEIAEKGRPELVETGGKFYLANTKGNVEPATKMPGLNIPDGLDMGKYLERLSAPVNMVPAFLSSGNRSVNISMPMTFSGPVDQATLPSLKSSVAEQADEIRDIVIEEMRREYKYTTPRNQRDPWKR